MFLEILGRNTKIVCFTCGINISQYNVVSQSQGFCKFRKKSLGTCVGMRLEYTPYFLMRIILRCVKGSFDFCWMMCVVINDGNAADFSLVLETTVCACKASEAFDNYLIRKIQKAK